MTDSLPGAAHDPAAHPVPTHPTTPNPVAWAAPPGVEPPSPAPTAAGWGPPPPPPPAPGWAAGAPAPWGSAAFVPGPTKPGIVALRPLGLSDILDGAIGYVRREPKTVLTISMLLALILAALSFLTNLSTFQRFGTVLTDPTATADDPFATTTTQSLSQVNTIVGYLIGLIVGVVADGVLIVVLGQAVLGRRTTAGSAWGTVRPQLPRLIGMSLLVGLILGVVFIGGIAIAIGVGFALYQAVTGLGILVGIAIGVGAVLASIWLRYVLQLTAPALVLERIGVRQALRRSIALVRGSWWRIFGISLLAAIIAAIIAGVFSLPFTIAGLVLSLAAGGSLWWAGLLVSSIGTFASSLLTIPFSAGVTGLLYIDQRIRREALDIELARAAST